MNTKIVLNIVIVIVVTMGVAIIYYIQAGLLPDGGRTPAVTYYDWLKQSCEGKEGMSCCVASVDAMEKSQYLLAENGACPTGYSQNTLKCIGSYEWCEPKSGEPVCENYDVENCPEGCGVCPPCIYCSSISCRTEEFCESTGFDKGWYDSVKPEPPLPKVECVEEQRNVDACIELYQPVCATVNIQCITTPCDPVEETYSNSCNACSNPLVSSYREGECE